MTEEKIKQLVIDNMKYEQVIMKQQKEIKELKGDIKFLNNKIEQISNKDYYKNYYENEIFEIIDKLQNIVGDDK